MKTFYDRSDDWREVACAKFGYEIPRAHPWSSYLLDPPGTILKSSSRIGHYSISAYNCCRPFLESCPNDRGKGVVPFPISLSHVWISTAARTSLCRHHRDIFSVCRPASVLSQSRKLLQWQMPGHGSVAIDSCSDHPSLSSRLWYNLRPTDCGLPILKLLYLVSLLAMFNRHLLHFFLKTNNWINLVRFLISWARLDNWLEPFDNQWFISFSCAELIVFLGKCVKSNSQEVQRFLFLRTDPQ